MSRGTWLPSFSFLLPFQKEHEFGWFLCATGYSHIWVVYAWLWSCGSNGMYNNRLVHIKRGPRQLRGGLGVDCVIMGIFLFFFLFLHWIIGNEIYQLRLDCACMEIRGVNHGSRLADMDIIIGCLTTFHRGVK